MNTFFFKIKNKIKNKKEQLTIKENTIISKEIAPNLFHVEYCKPLYNNKGEHCGKTIIEIPCIAVNDDRLNILSSTSIAPTLECFNSDRNFNKEYNKNLKNIKPPKHERR